MRVVLDTNTLASGALALMLLLGGVSAGTLALALRYIPHPHPKPSA